jgi:arabinose-5-phosphate isomerase
MTTVSTLITPGRVLTIGLDASLADAASKMADTGVSHLMVTEGRQLVGVVCVCDLDAASDGSRLRQLMRAEPVTIAPDALATEAAALMLSAGVSCLPVVGAGELCGVITLHELRRLGLFESDPVRCSACGSEDHVRCAQHGGLVGWCFSCMRQSEASQADDELGGGD